MTPRVHYILVVLLFLFVAGCLNKPDLPGHRSGSLTVDVQLSEGSSNMADIQYIKGALSMKEDELEQEVTATYQNANMRLNFEKVYPGNWNVAVTALDSVNDTIFQGSTDIHVDSDATSHTVVTLSPASSSLSISYDASSIPGIGTMHSKGRFGVFLNPTSNRGTYYDLSLEKRILSGFIKKIPAGDFKARICVPNASSPVYSTPKFQIQLYPGKKSTIHVKPDGTVITNPNIEIWPPTPTDLRLSRQENRITLEWQPATAPHVIGYRIYRTNSEGFFTMISTCDGLHNQFSEEVTKKMAYKKRILYAISAYDQNGFESLWSESREVNF